MLPDFIFCDFPQIALRLNLILDKRYAIINIQITVFNKLQQFRRQIRTRDSDCLLVKRGESSMKFLNVSMLLSFHIGQLPLEQQFI